MSLLASQIRSTFAGTGGMPGAAETLCHCVPKIVLFEV